MSERELIAMMAAQMWSCNDITSAREAVLQVGEIVFAVSVAEAILREVDARIAARCEPPEWHVYVAGPMKGVCITCGCDANADAHKAP
jgi:hypothetical protein